MNNLVLINVQELRKSINRYASRTGKTYSYVLRKLFGVSTSTFSEAIARFNKLTGDNLLQDVYGYLTKSMYQRLETGYNEHVTPVFFLSKSYFSKKFLIGRMEHDAVKKSVKDDTITIVEDIKIEKSEKIKKALNSVYGIYGFACACSDNSTKVLQMELGHASNLIPVMAFKGASDEEISYAVYYSKDLIEMIKKHARFKQLYDNYCAVDCANSSAQVLQSELEHASNLLTDMALKGAPEEDISYVVRYSKDIIDMIKRRAHFNQLSDKYCAKKV